MSYNYKFNCSEYCLHDGDEPIGPLLNEVAICFDLESGTRHKHGDPIKVQTWHQKTTKKLREAGVTEMADNLIVISGRFPIEELNKCLDISGHVLRMYKRILDGEVQPSDPFGSQFTGRPELPAAIESNDSKSPDKKVQEEYTPAGKRTIAFRKPAMRP